MDQECDASELLNQLSLGLLATDDVSKQVSCALNFTTLFQRYPTPDYVTPGFLKLAEAFRIASNFMRVQICEVFERNQKYMDKIYSVDEFLRPIFNVTTSNDPIARSITLLILGHMAPVVSHYRNIHHCISINLESTTGKELHATIACAASYVKHSSEFACNIYPKIVSIIDSNDSPTDVKIRALSVFDHSFYNATDAMTVRSFLIDVMNKTKLLKMISICLTLSTKIAYTSLSQILPQIELLLRTFQTDSRPEVKLNALKNLRFLATKSPHIWESAHLEPLIAHMSRATESMNDVDLKDPCFDIIMTIFCRLLTCDCNFIGHQEKAKVSQMCQTLSRVNRKIPLCVMATELMDCLNSDQSPLYDDRMIEY